jgi:hypothetical protein
LYDRSQSAEIRTVKTPTVTETTNTHDALTILMNIRRVALIW